jgi:hypothetical protein
MVGNWTAPESFKLGEVMGFTGKGDAVVVEEPVVAGGLVVLGA